LAGYAELGITGLMPSPAGGFCSRAIVASAECAPDLNSRHNSASVSLRPTGSQGEKVNETQTGEQWRLSSAASFQSIEELLTAFDQHLERQRGCTEGTRQHYRREARALLVRVFPDQRINWGDLTAGQIADFVSGRTQKLSLVSRQNPATAIRSLSRFLTSEGLIRAGLDGAAPPIWRSKHATVPRHMSAEQLENMLALCPLGGRGAMRNRAMLLLSARLGLRPSEVLRLRSRLPPLASGVFSAANQPKSAILEHSNAPR
jgi:hypothetical protein